MSEELAVDGALTAGGEQLLASLERALAAGASAPPATTPWLAWLAVCLCRQRVRQRWLVEVAEGLRDLDAGDVPGLPGWRFNFHGSGLCLLGPGHECLDYDFREDDADGATIDPWFFANRVADLDPPPPAEAQLARWLPTSDMVVAGLDELRRTGVIGPRDSHVFRLCPWLEARSSALAADGFALGPDPDDAEAGYHAWIASQLTDRRQALRMVRGLGARVGMPAMPWCLTLLDGPIDSATGGAVESLAAMPGDATSAVAALLDRLDPAQHHPYPVHAIAAYLLARGGAAHRERTLAITIAFAEIEKVEGYGGNPYLDQLAILVLEHDPPRGLVLVRRALRTTTPAVVERVASLLGAIDQPWSRRELVAALGDDGQHDLTNRRPLAAALARTSDPATRHLAAVLRPPPPMGTPDGVGFTFDELVADKVDEDWYAEENAPIAARLRADLPDVF